MSKGKCSNEQLVIRIKAGIDVSDNMLQLWEQNRGFIATIAKKFCGYAEMDDLLQQGYLGLCQAVDAYDPDVGAPFVDYAAYWLRQNMQRYVMNCGCNARIPVQANVRARKYLKLCDAYEAHYGRKPTDRELERALGVSWNVLEDVKKSVAMLLIGSLDVPVGEDDGSSMYDLLPGQESPEDEIVDHLQEEQLRETLWDMVDELPGQQSTVIRMRYQEGATLKETGEAAGLSVEQTRQLQNKALRSLREPRRAKKLAPFLDEEIRSMAFVGNGAEHFNRTWTSSTERAAIALADLEGETAREKERMRRASWKDRY